MKILLTTLILAATFSITNANAMGGADMKKMALDACKVSAANVPAAQKQSVLSMCECTVEKTDYDKVMKLSQEGKTQEVQADAQKVALECSKKYK